MRFSVAADVNGPRNYHLGDQAMLEANLHTFRQIFRDNFFTSWLRRKSGTPAAMLDQSLGPALTPRTQCGVTVRKNIRF
jgi:hypothetical protein